jgi:hypothetical protein
MLMALFRLCRCFKALNFGAGIGPAAVNNAMSIAAVWVLVFAI